MCLTPELLLLVCTSTLAKHFLLENIKDWETRLSKTSRI